MELRPRTDAQMGKHPKRRKSKANKAKKPKQKSIPQSNNPTKKRKSTVTPAPVSTNNFSDNRMS